MWATQGIFVDFGAWQVGGCEGGSGSQGSRTVLRNRGPLSVDGEKEVIPAGLENTASRAGPLRMGSPG